MQELPQDDRERAETRLRHNQIAWLTSVRPDGQPISVPVWFLFRDDATVLFYSQPGKAKLRNIAANPKVSLALDGTDIGRNIVRLEGIAEPAPDEKPAHKQPDYLAKIPGTHRRLVRGIREVRRALLHRHDHPPDPDPRMTTDEILRLSHDFDEADLHADTERLQTLLTEDFFSIGDQGYVLNRQGWIDRLGEYRLIKYETTDVTVRLYEHTAIVHGTQRSEATWLGEAMTSNVRFSQVWVQLQSGWQVASVQFSPLPTP